MEKMTDHMYVIKRDGSRVPVSFDEILQRIRKLSDGLDHVNPDLVAQKVCNQLSDGMETRKLDEFAGEVCAMMQARFHPNYGKLAARIVIDNHHKNTPSTLQDCIEKLYHGPVQLITDEYHDLVNGSFSTYQGMIDYSRDFMFDYFGFKTLERSYLLKQNGVVVERPQHLWMRVAIQLHKNDMYRVKETYDALSLGYFIHATPTLFNSGTLKPQLSSCFIAGTKVHTLNGVKNIEDVMLDDEVVTHTGSVKKVKQLHTNLLGTRDLFTIKIAGTPSITVTGNHRLMSLSDEQDKWGQKPTWNRVDYLRVGDWIAIPNKKYSEEIVIDIKTYLDKIIGDGDNIQYSYEYEADKVYPKFIYQTHHVTGNRTHTKRVEPINRYWKITPNVMELLGIWFGDGCVVHAKNSSRNMKPRAINIVSYHNNEELINFVTQTFKSFLGVEHITISTDKHGMTSMNVNNTIIANLFANIFKTGFDGKRLPTFFNKLPYEHIRHFLAGLTSSDGCVSSSNVVTIQLTNPPLMTDIYHLARSVGIPVTLTMMHSGDKKPTGRMSVPFYILKGLIKKVYYDDRLCGDSEPWSLTRVIDGVTFMRLNAKDICNERPTYVYTLGVEDDHSYSVGGIVAENCFLIQLQNDSIQGIYKTLADCAEISKWAGGIGLNIHNVRARGARIRGTNGESTGIVPMLKVFNDTARYVNQGGKRNGSFAVYLEPWHADVEDFLRLKLNQGAEEERARDLFYALWIPDLFMKRLEADQDWTLMCPDECPGLADVWGDEFEKLYTSYESAGKGRKTLPAKKLWQLILDSQIQTGTPYLCYKDAANAKSNQSNLGTIKSSNLCVAPETLILTKDGYFPIKDLVKDESVEVWNGERWSKTEVHKTGEMQKLITINFSNGATLTCTPYHKFLIHEGYEDNRSIKDSIRVDAQDLKKGMKLKKWQAPIIDGFDDWNVKDAYTHGFFCGDGTISDGKPVCSLYGEKKKLVPYLNIKSMSGIEDASGRLNTILKPIENFPAYENKFHVPLCGTIKTKIAWLEGLCDADGCIARNGTNESIQIASINFKFLDDIRMMLLTVGIHSKVTKAHDVTYRDLPDGKGGVKEFECKPLWRLLLSSNGLYALSQLGFSPKRLTFTVRKPQRNAEKFVKIESVVNTERYDDTYCFNEPLNHAGVFNGVLTGNCTEIIEFTSDKETAVCNLGSLALPKFVDMKSNGPSFNFDRLREYTKILTRNLDIVIDKNFYPTSECEYSNKKNRPIGIGVQGLADVFAMLQYSWSSDEAKKLNREIFENIYYAATQASIYRAFDCSDIIPGHYGLREHNGVYASYLGSPASHGQLQYHLWNEEPRETPYLDWAELIVELRMHGMRNSLLVAPMPTASTSQILGNTECFEPFTSNLYARRVLAGDFMVVNKYLVDDLMKLNLWNSEVRTQIIANNGSVQNILEIPEEIRERYRTAWEIPQKVLINMARDRAPFICQSQSLNLFLAEPTYAKISSMHMYAWKQGLKTGCYYLRTKPVATAQKFTVEPTKTSDCLTCSS